MMFGTPGHVKNCINAKDEDESKDRTYLSQAIDVIFLSPPWGGVDYGKVGGHGYDLTGSRSMPTTESKATVSGVWNRQSKRWRIKGLLILYSMDFNWQKVHSEPDARVLMF